MMHWIQTHPLLLGGLCALAFGILWMMPGRQSRPRLLGLVPVVLGTVTLGYLLGLFSGPWTESALVVLFGGAAIVAGALMITCRNPVYGSLWFALVTLCTCGLFVLQDAPFLAAATMIVYAGAIIVTFIFVIMLAQQGGATHYDRTAHRPVTAVLLGMVCLGIVLGTLQSSQQALLSNAQPVAQATIPNPLSRPELDKPLGTMHGLGRSLFGDYLYAVELAGTLLLIASIGAIVIAPNRGATRT